MTFPATRAAFPPVPTRKRPPFVSDSTTGGSYTWAATTADPRALRQAGGTSRIAAQWYGNPSLDIDCPLTDGRIHQAAVYALDWDNFQGGRSETVQVLDAGSGAVLDSRTLAAGPSFVSGTYLVWNVKGHVLFHVVRNSGVNATLSGLFFDPSPAGRSRRIDARCGGSHALTASARAAARRDQRRQQRGGPQPDGLQLRHLRYYTHATTAGFTGAGFAGRSKGNGTTDVDKWYAFNLV